MGQGQARERPPCEKEKQDWEAANKRFAIKNAELEKLRNFSDLKAKTLAQEVATLEQEMKAKRQRYDKCMEENAGGDL
jgi:hypothetical protein